MSAPAPACTMAPPLVSVVLLTYNRRAFLARSLRAVVEQAYPHLEVVVVDNASVDDTAAYVAAHFPAVRLVRNSRNLFFTGGMNTGIRAARGELLLLLTDDVVLERDYVAKLVPLLLHTPDLALVAGVLYDADTGQVRCAGARVQFGLDALRIVHEAVAPAVLQGNGLQPVPYVPPTLTLARRAALDAVGGFDDDFQFTGEDIDLVLKLRRRGYRIALYPAAAAYHLPPGTLAYRENETIDFHMEKNIFLLYFKFAPLATLLGFLGYRYAWLAKQWGLALLGRRPPLRRATVRAHLWWLGQLPRLLAKRWQLRGGPHDAACR
ncbi:MAG TPA: glycosyltransferase family 2 protein [Chloroflexota bacterium]|nr:glycosyltransferase family 2 protein [Chloroflexota bacterium]